MQPLRSRHSSGRSGRGKEKARQQQTAADSATATSAEAAAATAAAALLAEEEQAAEAAQQAKQAHAAKKARQKLRKKVESAVDAHAPQCCSVSAMTSTRAPAVEAECGSSLPDALLSSCRYCPPPSRLHTDR